ncbi:hypothetical protein JTB14_000874 [Gonioctena quinquepunctata]|nr:hypothetical protein JTB14_000874 [Gonioctena quinquepunctata]
MMNIFCIFFVVLVLVSQTRSDYVAAVVEYQSIKGTAPNKTIEENLHEYVTHIENAKGKYAEIIVFPEYGLTGMVEDPKEYSIEVPETGSGPNFTNYYLEELSKAARGHAIYVVVNLLEKTKNEKNKTLYYNTNVAFDKEGKIVGKSRKINLYYEPMLTPGNSSENRAIFNTDFGITFGMFTCFDMFFFDPSRSILVNTSVSDIIFPTAWFSALPFFHSLSFHSAYAMANKVNVLASNLNDPMEGMGGSGVYGADGTVFSYFISGTPSSKLIITSVKNTAKDFSPLGFEILDETSSKPLLDGYLATRYFESHNYQFKDLDLSQETLLEQICDGSFCCSFNITVSPNNSTDFYKLMAYRGPNRLEDFLQQNVKICSLVACKTILPSSCGTSNVTLGSQFKSISVETSVDDIFDEFYQPITLTTDLLPVFNTTFNSTVANGSRSIVYATNKMEKNVLAFGIYGNSGNSVGFSLLLLGVMMMAKYIV